MKKDWSFTPGPDAHEIQVESMTPDKTLEELERILAEFHKHVMECAYDDANPNHICPDTARLNPILLLFQSATEAQQREVERLSEQLRTESQRRCLALTNIQEFLVAFRSAAIHMGELGYGHVFAESLKISEQIASALSHSGKEGV